MVNCGKNLMLPGKNFILQLCYKTAWVSNSARYVIDSHLALVIPFR